MYPTMHKRRHRQIIAAAGISAAAALFAPPTANAAAFTSAEETVQLADATGALDPNTFAGPVQIATTKGEVIVNVKAGGLPEAIIKVRTAVQNGTLDPSQPLPGDPTGSCDTWKTGTALIGGGWTTSLNGCAVVGYPGYVRPYSWANGSDVQGCVRAKGFTPNGTGGGTQGWYTLGCVDSNNVGVPWGNVLAYTQVQARSLSIATGMGYKWRD
jgi:hypothetical protein